MDSTWTTKVVLSSAHALAHNREHAYTQNQCYCLSNNKGTLEGIVLTFLCGIYMCVSAYVCMYGDWSSCQLSDALHCIFLRQDLLLSLSSPISYAGWLVNSRDLPVCLSGTEITGAFWFPLLLAWEPELGSPWLYSKHFASSAISTVPEVNLLKSGLCICW